MAEQVGREIDSGRLRGCVHDGAYEFLGVPYATAPRFAPPGEQPGWTGVRDATVAGPASPQPARPAALFTHGELPGIDEECLNLNVFTSELSGSRPVLVWIHGGGFTIGHASASIYRGSQLARETGIVVVTVNYRLGDLGWLWHPRLAAEPGGAAGNWALLDLIAALRWVRRNIAAFGGDADRVTLAGQSAGALAALDLLCAPPAVGLFQRLIAQSPPLVDLAQPPGVAIAWAEALSAACGGTAAGLDRAALLSAAPGRLVALHERLLDEPAFRGTRGGALPTLDPALLPRSALEDPGACTSVDVLVGHTADEGTFFFGSPWRPAPPPEAVAGIVAHLCHTDTPEAVLAGYRERARSAGHDGDAQSLLIAIATDAMFDRPIAAWADARAHATDADARARATDADARARATDADARARATDADAGSGGRVFRYRVDHPGAGPNLRATHTAEVPLLFGTWEDGEAGERLGGQAPGAGAVAADLVRAWSGFVHDGAPGWEPVAPSRSVSAPHVFGSAVSREAATGH